MAGGLAFVPAQRSDAQVSVGIGVGYPAYGYSYYGYPGYGNGYYPYRYYRPYRYYGYYNGGPTITGTVTTATIGTIITIIATNLK